MSANFNPFGKDEDKRTCLEILQKNFGIGIREYDRGADIWDPNFIDEKGNKKPSWVHKPVINLECCVVFSVNKGQGTGRQIIPANEFTNYVAALQNIIDTDYAEPKKADRTEYIPTDMVAAQSFKMTYPKIQVIKNGKTSSKVDKTADRNIVSVRCVSGKGAKPMTVPKDEFPGVVKALQSIASDIKKHEKTAWDNYNATKEDDSSGE